MKWQPINEFDFSKRTADDVIFHSWLLGPLVGYCSSSGWRYDYHRDGMFSTYLLQGLGQAELDCITHFMFITNPTI
jgi:hypothetical protein